MSACEICNGEGWTCELHPLTPWDNGNGCCGAAGMPCRCNPMAKVEWDEIVSSAQSLQFFTQRT